MMNTMPGNINNLYITLYLICINLIAFLCMKLDKGFAQKNFRRISENNLLTIALFGGTLGLWIGMFHYRHKTKKIKFLVGLPLIFLVQIYVCWLVLF